MYVLWFEVWMSTDKWDIFVNEEKDKILLRFSFKYIFLNGKKKLWQI